MPNPGTPSPSPLANPALRTWLAGCLDLTRLDISHVSSPDAGGWSNETHLFTAAGERDGKRTQSRLVLRLVPDGPAMFRDYDLRRQITCMRFLEDFPQCPVPRVVADDPQGTVIGRPLFVMSFIPGEVPADDKPTFFEAGFLFDAPASQQRRFHDQFLQLLVALHQIVPQSELTRALTRGQDGTALEREVTWLGDLYRWGGGPDPQPLIERALEWVAEHLPADATEVLLWGDARPANVIVRDFAPVAMLDWELATLGPPELDVFWLLEMNHMRSRGKLLPGFPHPDQTIADYEHRSGRPIAHREFHAIYAALKVALLMLRHLRVRQAHGALPEGSPVLTDNVATRRLAGLLTNAGAV